MTNDFSFKNDQSIKSLLTRLGGGDKFKKNKDLHSLVSFFKKLLNDLLPPSVFHLTREEDDLPALGDRGKKEIGRLPISGIGSS